MMSSPAPISHSCAKGVVAKRLQLDANPLRTLPVAAGMADEDVRHAPPPAACDGASSYREIRGARSAKGENPVEQVLRLPPPRTPPSWRNLAFNQNPLSHASRPFIGSVLKGSSGSKPQIQTEMLPERVCGELIAIELVYRHAGLARWTSSDCNGSKPIHAERSRLWSSVAGSMGRALARC